MTRRRNSLASRFFTVVLLSMGVGLVVSTLGSALATYLVLQRSRADEMAYRVGAASDELSEALMAGRPSQLTRALTHVADASNVRAVFAYSPHGALLAARPRLWAPRQHQRRAADEGYADSREWRARLRRHLRCAPALCPAWR